MLTNLHISELFTTFVMKLDDVSAEKSGILCTSFARHFIASLLSLGILKTSFRLPSLTRRLVLST